MRVMLFVNKHHSPDKTHTFTPIDLSRYRNPGAASIAAISPQSSQIRPQRQHESITTLPGP